MNNLTKFKDVAVSVAAILFSVVLLTGPISGNCKMKRKCGIHKGMYSTCSKMTKSEKSVYCSSKSEKKAYKKMERAK